MQPHGIGQAELVRPSADGLELAPKLTESDRGLIRALQEDGRRSFAGIAAELGISERLVRKRVGELRAQGVIKITTVADPELMGYRMIAMACVRVDPRERVSEVAAQLARVSCAFYVIVVSGPYNVLVELSCTDSDHLLAMVDEEISRVPGVISLELLPYLRLHYQNPAFEAAILKAPGAAGGARREAFSFEDVDREIIKFLHDDGRMPFRAMALELGISESQVRARVKRMVGSEALRIMALTIPRGVGFETVALIGVTVSLGFEIERVARALTELHSVIYVAICAGRFDILAEAVCVDQEALLALLDQELRTVPGVAAAEPWIYLQLHYRSVQPAPPH